MALTTPILYDKVAFDATQETTFKYSTTGGDQATRTALVIYQDGVLIKITDAQTGIGISYVLSANELENGQSYDVALLATNGIADTKLSNFITIKCFTSPTLSWENSTSTINNSNYDIVVKYNQEEKELLNGVYLVLQADSAYTSETIYSTETPPLDILFNISSLINNQTYKMQFFAKTVNGTEISSEVYEFNVNYQNTNSKYNLLQLENQCNDGSVLVKSEYLTIDGTLYKDEAIYIDNSVLDLRDFTNYVYWEQGFNIDTSQFAFQIWGFLNHTKEFAVFALDENKQKYYSFSLLREVPYGETELKDRIEVQVIEDEIVVATAYSNYLSPINILTEVIINFVKNANTISLDFRLVENIIDSTVVWYEEDDEDVSNVEYEDLTNIELDGAEIAYAGSSVGFNNGISFDEITYIEIKNGKYDHLYITQNIDVDLDNIVKYEKEDWDSSTVFICDFNGNIFGGSVNEILNNIDYLMIKRKEYGTNDWIVLEYKEINSVEDLRFEYVDNLALSNKTYIYALVPLRGNVEGDYQTNEIDVFFNHLYILNTNNKFQLYSNLNFSQTQNIETGIFTPIGSKYPIMIKNSDINYKTGTVSANIYGYNFLENKTVDVKDLILQKNDIVNFLTDGSVKLIKDSYGQGVICVIPENVECTIYQTQKYATISFSYIEIGSLSEQSDLDEFGLVGVI